MVRKKERIQPVVAKPLNDNTKRNLVTSFVTSNVNDIVTNNVTKGDTEDESKIVTNDETKNVSNDVTEQVTSNVTKIDTNIVTDNVTKEITSNVTQDDTSIVTNQVTKKVSKSVTKKVTKNVTIVKTISLGKKEIVAKFTSNKRSRPNYNLSEDTIEKIEKISDILGYKKAEFIDIYLNGTLEKVLRDLEKSNKK